MKKGVWLLWACLLAANLFAQKKTAVNSKTTEGYRIKMTVKPYKKTWVYIGCYYGKFQNLVDSVFLDNNSVGLWEGQEKLPQGIYFVVSPTKTMLRDFLMDDAQHFNMDMDTSSLDKFRITGSKENDIYANYTSYISNATAQLNQWNQQLRAGSPDSAGLKSKIRQRIDSFDLYRNHIISRYPKSMIGQYFQAMKIPVFKVKNKDTAAAFYAVKEHYWDGVDFSDDKYLRTPFFDKKLEDYFKHYVAPAPDSIIPEVNYLLLYSRDAKDLHKYLLGRFTDEYINPKIMGQDKVFLFLFNNFYSKGDTTWLNEKQKKYIFDRAYSLMANQIGAPAPALALSDSTGTLHDLQQLDAKYTLVLFWDPDCSHCKVIVPQVDSIYNAKWKALGLKVYAVNTSEEPESKATQFIKEKHLEDWTHVYQPKEAREADAAAGRPNYRQLFDVTETPTLYLLDKNKNIIAKKLTIAQFDGLIDAQEKK